MDSFYQRFIFEHHDVCGVVVRMHDALEHVLSRHHYPDTVKRALADCLMSSVLLSSRMKTPGEITLQLKGGGSIKLLVAKCDANQNVRGVAQYDIAEDKNALALDFSAGNLVITYRLESSGKHHQSIVNIQGHSVTVALEHYFLQSEQVPTIMRLDDEAGIGIMLQRMPGSKPVDDEDWALLRQDLNNVDLNDESLAMNDLLKASFPDRLLRVFDAEPVGFRCSCSRKRMHAALMTLSSAELEEIFDEKSEVSLECEYCLETYTFKSNECIK